MDPWEESNLVARWGTGPDLGALVSRLFPQLYQASPSQDWEGMSEQSEYATMGFEPLYNTRFHVNMVGPHRQGGPFISSWFLPVDLTKRKT